MPGFTSSATPRGRKKATPSGSKKPAGPPTEQKAKKATPSSKERPRTRSKTHRSPVKAKKATYSPRLEARMKRWRKQRVLETVSPHSFVRSRANDIRDSPWLSKEEFAAVYTWLYSNKTELMSKGVARVAAWSTRGKLPVGIDITAHLCEAFLMEMKHSAGNSYQAVSFGFSVAITRLVKQVHSIVSPFVPY